MDSQELEIRKIVDDSINIMSNYVIPIYTTQKNKPKQIGSGFFVHAQGQYYLLSAAHVLKETLKNELFIYIEPKKQMRLVGNVRVNNDEKNIDVGVIKLTQGLMPPYPTIMKTPIDIKELKPRLLPRDGKLLAIVGFPGSKSKLNPINKTVSVTAYGYYENSIEDESYVQFNLCPETHIAMKLNLKEGINNHGKPIVFPKPSGMSGSPIWLLHDYNTDEEHRIFPIVGIGIEYRKKDKILVGTDIHYGIELIESFYKN
jgi:hypothetical protein